MAGNGNTSFPKCVIELLALAVKIKQRFMGEYGLIPTLDALNHAQNAPLVEEAKHVGIASALTLLLVLLPSRSLGAESSLAESMISS